jgi:hypothetical protein
MATVHNHEARFPPTTLDWPGVIPHLGPAAAAVARYDGMFAAVPNPYVLLSPLTTQKAEHRGGAGGPLMRMGSALETLQLTLSTKVSHKIACGQSVSGKLGDVR